MSTNEIILAVVCAVLVVFSLVVAIVVPKRNPDFPARKLGAFFLVSIALVAGMLVSVEVIGAEDEGTEAAQPAETTQPAETQPPAETGATEAAPAGDPAAGKEVFASAGCGACHTLADAGASGAVGPSLDESKPDLALVLDRVANGQGAMPSFQAALSDEQIQDVAAYVVQASSG